MNGQNWYQENLISHYKNPHNWGTIDNAHFSSGLLNPSCGDSIEITGIFENATIAQLAFTGKGCVLSLATASLLTDYCRGKTEEEVMNLTASDVSTLVGIVVGPVRTKCLLLPLQALQQALLEYQKRT